MNWNFFKKEEKNIKPKQYSRAFYQAPSEPVWSKFNYVNASREAYVKNVVANRCISVVVNGASSVKLKLKNRYTGEILQEHPLMKLLNRPNCCSNINDFFKALYSYKILSGNAYILAKFDNDDLEKCKEPTALFLLRPDRVSILTDNKMIPVAYKYVADKIEKFYYVDSVNGSSEILHIKNFHPLDDWYGMSEVEPAGYSIDQHNEASKWNQAMLQNGARPSGALIVKTEANDGFLTDEQFDRLKSQLDEEYSGSINAGKPLLLEGGLEWKEMSLSPKDMDFLEIKYSTAREIALSFGVPSQLLGIPGDNTYSNFAEARLFLWEQTILPMIDNVLSNLNSWLCPMYGDDLELFYDIHSINALSSKREKLWDNVNKATFLSDEKKREILNLDNK